MINSNKSCIRMIQSKNSEPNPLNSVSNANKDKLSKFNNNIELQANQYLTEFRKKFEDFDEEKFNLSSSLLKTLKIVLPINSKDNRIVYTKKVVNSTKTRNNIENFLRLMEDFSQLKNILLNEDQKKLFELNSKINVYDEAGRQHDMFTNLRNKDIDNLMNIDKFQTSDTISMNLKNQLYEKVKLLSQS